VNDYISKFSNLKITQDNICKQFVEFGEGIDINTKRLDNLEPFCYKLKETKAEQTEFRKRVSGIERDGWRCQQELEDVRVDISKTDKHIMSYLPINMVTEMTNLVAEVLPRRRHRTLL